MCPDVFGRLLWEYMTHARFLNIQAGLSETFSSSSQKHGTSAMSFPNMHPTGVKLEPCFHSYTLFPMTLLSISRGNIVSNHLLMSCENALTDQACFVWGLISVHSNPIQYHAAAYSLAMQPRNLYENTMAAPRPMCAMLTVPMYFIRSRDWMLIVFKYTMWCQSTLKNTVVLPWHKSKTLGSISKNWIYLYLVTSWSIGCFFCSPRLRKYRNIGTYYCNI